MGVLTSTIHIDRDMLSKSQGYTLAERATKKTTQADIDKAYQRLHTNMEVGTGAENQMNGSDVHKFLNRASAASSDGGNIGSSAFDGQLARLGGIRSLKAELDAGGETWNEDEKQCEEDIGADEGGQGSGSEGRKRPSTFTGGNESKKKRIEGCEDMWFEKEIRISAAKRSQESWRNDMRKTMQELHKEGLDLKRSVNEAGLEHDMAAEMKCIKVRGHALALVQGLRDHNRPHTDQPECRSTLSTAAVTAHSQLKPTPEKEPGPDRRARPGEGEAAGDGETLESKDLKNPEAAAGQDGETKDQEKADKPADNPEPAAAEVATEMASAEEKREKTPETPEKSSAATSSTSPGNDGKADDTVSVDSSSAGLSPAALEVKHASRALKVFLAGFSIPGNGQTPPCRSFRSLITLAEFSPFFERLVAAESEDDLKVITDEIKPFKLAHNDLVSMARNAGTTIKNALKSRKSRPRRSPIQRARRHPLGRLLAPQRPSPSSNVALRKPKL